LVQGLKLVPWMAKPNDKNGWQYCKVPSHGTINMPFNEIAKKLKDLLVAETLQCLEGKKTVGILLSGGMDSRILAGIIKDIQLRKDFSGDIVAFTWGLKNTRDVVYAAKIAHEYKWQWVHLELSPELLERNIYITGELGATFAPYHLHAMPAIRAREDLDAVIAGSYGDSVGRAEFSGKHVLSLRTVIPKKFNRLGLVRNHVVADFLSKISQDAYEYRKNVKRSVDYQYYEIENQLHYMRRKLQPCMSYIAEKVPCYQIFTHPETFGFMWSLDPKIRNDEVYKDLIALLPGKIAQIPWAKTGKPYLQNDKQEDEYCKHYHAYGVWLRQDLRKKVFSLVDSDTIRGLGLFNDAALDRLLKLWSTATTTTVNNVDEAIAWLASLSVFAEKYKIKGYQNLAPLSLKDKFFSWKAYVRAYVYLKAREKFRD